MKFNWFYLLVIILFGAMLWVSLQYFKGSRHSSLGVTQGKEYKINAGQPALVKAVKVISGQQVKAGDLLIELTSNTLEIDIDKLRNRIQAMKSEQIENAKLADSDIAYMRADQGVFIEKINTEIGQAESEVKLNRKLTKRFITTQDSVVNDHPIEIKLEALKKQRARQQEAIAIKVKDILQKSESEQRLRTNQISLLERELELLMNEKNTLNKFAAADGQVGNVYVRPGEQVDAFTSLLSINPVHPTTVVGFLTGKKEDLPLGAKVMIQSYEHNSVAIDGKVIGYGAVTELPEILQKSTAVKSFGREIFIEISVRNNFSTGEKVLIR